MKKFNLCSEGSCCPEVIVNGDTVIVTDDDGGRVTLTKEQVKILWDKIR